jgi:putative nucleotidyltransferase with HDIG domain
METGNIIIAIQFMGIIIPLIGIIVLIQKEQGKSSMFLMLTNIGCLIMNSGYYMLLKAGADETADMAYSIEYVGNVVFYLFFFLFMLSYLHIKYPKWLTYLLGLFELCDLVIFWGFPKSGLIFEHIEFVFHENVGIRTVDLEPGMIYMIRYCIICMLLLIGVIYTSFKLTKVESKSEKSNIGRLAGTHFVVMISLILMLMCRFDFDIVPIFASFSIISIILGVIQGEMFSVIESGRQWAFENMDGAIVIVDSSYGYLESNESANQIFNDLRKKQKNEKISPELYAIMASNAMTNNAMTNNAMTNNVTTGGQGEEYIDGKYYEKNIDAIMEGNKIKGYSLLLVDVTRQHEFNKYLQNEVEKQTFVAEQRRKSMERLSLQMVQALANTIDAKDAYTNGHSTRVAKYSVMIAEKMGYADEELERLRYAALLHDIGKIGIPREIINKTSRLTDEEYEIIKTHPVIGENILKEITEIPDISIGARWHHERYDGKGYPDHLSGDEIPKLARIIGVADAYDAMTSNRSYRGVLAQDIVYGEVEKGKGTQFAPEIADVMLKIMDEDKEYLLHE